MKQRICAVVVILLCLTVLGAWAIPPATINIHGALTAPDGTPLTGTRAYVVKFFDADALGTQLGGDLTGATMLSPEGLFNIPVVPPVEVLSAGSVWYELAIDTDVPVDGNAADDFFPERVRVHSVPFVRQAAEAEHVDAANIGNGVLDDAELDALDGVSGNVQTQIDAKVDDADLDLKADDADLVTHTGDTANPHTVTADQVGLGNVDNTADLAKPVSTAVQTALDAKAGDADLTAHEGDTANPHVVTKAQVGLGNADDTSDLNKPVSTDTQTALDLKADDADLTTHEGDAANPHTVTKAQVGLDNVDNTADADKPVSTAAQAALDAKANGADVYTKIDVDLSQAAQDVNILAKANAVDVYDKAASDGRYLQTESDTLAAVTERGAATNDLVTLGGGAQVDTVTENTLDNGVTLEGVKAKDSVLELAQVSAPSPATNRLYNVGGTAFFGGTQLGYPWTVVTGTAQTMASNHGYVANRASLVSFTLPVSAELVVGDTVRVTGMGAGGWKIAQGIGQYIRLSGVDIPIIGADWTARGSDGHWACVASSWDGQILLAGQSASGSGSGYLRRSTNSGASWTSLTGTGEHTWSHVSSSADGSCLLAAPNYGYLYTSSDGGVSWTKHTEVAQCSWRGTAMSADGAKHYAGGLDNQVYASSNGGTTWAATSAVTGRWWCMACSSDGAQVVAAEYGGYIYRSSDSGAAWTQLTGAGNRDWRSITSSSSGTKLAAGLFGGTIYISPDAGASWSATGAGSANWNDLASSSDGTRLLAARSSGYLQVSTDSGISWKSCTSGGSRNWYGVAVSADVSRLVAVSNYGKIYTSSSMFAASLDTTTSGTAGSLSGAMGDAVELQYIGGDTFVPISHEGSLGAQ